VVRDRFQRQVQVSKDREYEFRLHSDDGSILWIDFAKVIDNDGLHAPLSKSGRVRLAKGSRRIRVLYFQGRGTHLALQLFVTPPGGPEQLWKPQL
jgi:hexosaminidase